LAPLVANERTVGPPLGYIIFYWVGRSCRRWKYADRRSTSTCV